MSRNVFISFRYEDGYEYKKELEDLFNEDEDTVDCSEDKDRSGMSDDTIRDYLYGKLKRSSVTIMVLTPKAIEYQKDRTGLFFDDWIYDEIRYSLEDRERNTTNGLIAVYVPEAKPLLITENTHYCEVCKKTSSINSVTCHNNLIYHNMMNVKPEYKINKCKNVFDSNWDSYCSLVSFDVFKENYNNYIQKAYQKRGELYKYNLCKRLKP